MLRHMKEIEGPTAHSLSYRTGNIRYGIKNKDRYSCI